MTLKKIGNYDYKEIEPKTLEFWGKNKTYPKLKEKNKNKPKYYFLDGPPYTSGKVHIGTAWNKSLKDMVLRYKRMRGFNVWDRAGYDMHGLPTAHAVEKKLGLEGKQSILKFGMDKFIEECKKLCTDNLKIMNKDFQRLGVWMDFDNAYQSITKEFIEGEWWLIKKAHEKNRLYEGLRPMSWCASCATALAKHELEYKEICDDSIFVKFPVEGKDNEYFIIWTTTPWTIPYNLAIMVHPDFEYVKIQVEDEYWILAKGLANVVMSAVVGKKYKVIEEFKGKKLENTHYIHPLHKHIKHYKDMKADGINIHRILLSEEYVDLSSGSGLVHCAPGCGPEDYEIGVKNKIAPFNNLSEDGVFPKDMGKFAGLKAKTDDKEFIKALEDEEVLIASTKVDHDYAHCWRCHKPIVYKTTKQWFFKIDDLKEKMIEENKKIKWVPHAAFNAFNSWLENLRDNSITKQRFWGTPLPVWKCNSCDNYEVIGSIKELEEKSKQKVEKFHKPWIDEVKWKCHCGGEKIRIPDILDVWVDAGTTSWNCLDYPHREDLFKELFPAEFILEGKDQIRGWFNLLLVASMVSMDKPSFKKVYMHGFVQDAEGRKMSKSLGNYILPDEVINQYGADTLRYYMIGGTNPGIDINYNFEDMKLKHKNLGILWNLHKFLIDMSITNNIKPITLDKTQFAIEEEYIISKLNSTIKETTELMENYQLNNIPWKIEELFFELSRTYIQNVRDKSSIGTKEEKQLVLNVIYETLLNSIKLLSIVTPFITEEIYQNLKKYFDLKEDSIHNYEWPEADKDLINEELEKEFTIGKTLMQNILFGREKIQRGVRWPIKEVIIVSKNEDTKNSVKRLGKLIKKQTNIKNLGITKEMKGVTVKIKVNNSTIGKDFKELVPRIVTKMLQESTQSILNHLKKDNKHTMLIDEKKIELKKEHFIIEKDMPKNLIEVETSCGDIYINKDMTPELETEGYARELMRRIQQLRKRMGLEKKDEVKVNIKTDNDTAVALQEFCDDIKKKCGIMEIVINDSCHELRDISKEDIKGKKFCISCCKV